MWDMSRPADNSPFHSFLEWKVRSVAREKSTDMTDMEGGRFQSDAGPLESMIERCFGFEYSKPPTV